ncbi:MAG: hypothetical protein Q9182_003969 [Xanthomendoza sp. 2 TL-2023]
MTSPTRSLRRSPPRRPLHERSDSQANQRASPTSRTSADAQDYLYNSSPYPTHPLHIFSPKSASRPGLVPRVSESEDDAFHQDSLTGDFQHGYWASQDKERKGLTVLEDTENNYGGSVRPLSIGNARPIAVPPLNLNPSTGLTSNRGLMEDDNEDGIQWSEEIVPLPSISRLPEAQEPSITASNSGLANMQQPPDAKSSDLSLSSSDSTGTIIRHNVPRSRGSYSAFPPVSRPTSSKAGSSPSTPQKVFAPSSDDGESTPVSASSPIVPEVQTPLLPTTSRSHRAVSDVISLQYPIIRQPSASGSWAETSNDPQAVATRPQPRIDRNHDRWNPHLSTVPSELSEERGSDIWTPNFIAMNTSSLDVSAANQSSTHQQRDLTGSTIRMVNESDDNVSKLLSPIPGSRGSAYYSVLSVGSRNKRRSVSQARPTSRGSFFRDSIPAWAKLYYARSNSALALPGGRSDVEAMASLESLSVRRTRQRPNVETRNQDFRDSMAIGPAQPNGVILARVQGQPKQPISQVWSPHLWQDRRNGMQKRSLFKAPILDQHVEGPFGPRNIQVLLFPLGFVFPLVAAVLPLPQRPSDADSGLGADPAHDLEKTFGMIDEARYENARWWRHLNRLMCIVGALLIAAIIALAVVAVRMRN